VFACCEFSIVGTAEDVAVRDTSFSLDVYFSCDRQWQNSDFSMLPIVREDALANTLSLLTFVKRRVCQHRQQIKSREQDKLYYNQHISQMLASACTLVHG
jgi:hypothetical protein